MIPYVSASEFYKSLFGFKVYKVAVDSDCTCPNRDGTKGFGGCIFCSQSGSGDFAAGADSSGLLNGAVSVKSDESSESNKSIESNVISQIKSGIALVERKASGRSGKQKAGYIAYFQNFTATYGNPERLESRYAEALSEGSVVGISIATRPDCMDDDILRRIAGLKEKTGKFIQIELELQTSNDVTGELINRKYSTADFDDAVRRIKSVCQSIHIVAHAIFGLPGEMESDMLETVRHISFAGADGIKITVLYVVSGTVLAELYNRGAYECLEKKEYFDLLRKALLILPERIVVHRITGDPPKRIMLAPEWSGNKRQVLNELKEFLRS